MTSYLYKVLSNIMSLNADDIDDVNNDNDNDNEQESGKIALIVFAYTILNKISSLIRLPFVVLSMLFQHPYFTVITPKNNFNFFSRTYTRIFKINFTFFPPPPLLY